MNDELLAARLIWITQVATDVKLCIRVNLIRMRHVTITAEKDGWRVVGEGPTVHQAVREIVNVLVVKHDADVPEHLDVVRGL